MALAMALLPASSIEDFKFLKLLNSVIGVNVIDGLFYRDATTLKGETLRYIICQSHKDETNTYKS